MTYVCIVLIVNRLYTDCVRTCVYSIQICMITMSEFYPLRVRQIHVFVNFPKVVEITIQQYRY